MDLQKLSNLSKEELISLVAELDEKLNHQKELMNKVREHKHNYAEDFGLVVSAPVDALLKEFLSNPEGFSIDEKKKILEIYANSKEIRGIYECLGWSVDNQLGKVKNGMIPSIRNNAIFFSSIIGKATAFKNKWLLSILQRSLNETDSLCSRLENIEHFEYGVSEPFNLKAAIKEAFIKDKSNIGSDGSNQIYLVDYFWNDCSGTMVEMNRNSFLAYFLGNIIRNLHDHAFNDFDKFSTKLSLPRLRTRAFSYITGEMFKKGEIPVKSSWNREGKTAGSTMIIVQEKRVRISLKKDEKNEHRINLIIENNGNIFMGDVDDVFEKGIGDGDGEHIGLYSAKQFLKAYGATIKMFTDPNNEEGFKVGFHINLPIL